MHPRDATATTMLFEFTTLSSETDQNAHGTFSSISALSIRAFSAGSCSGENRPLDMPGRHTRRPIMHPSCCRRTVKLPMASLWAHTVYRSPHQHNACTHTQCRVHVNGYQTAQKHKSRGRDRGLTSSEFPTPARATDTLTQIQRQDAVTGHGLTATHSHPHSDSHTSRIHTHCDSHA